MHVRACSAFAFSQGRWNVLPVGFSVSSHLQTLSVAEYERKKEEVADSLVKRVEAYLPGLAEATVFREVGTPRTHRRFLSRYFTGSLSALPGTNCFVGSSPSGDVDCKHRPGA